MSEYKPIPVKAAADISKKFSKDLVVITSYSREHDMVHTTTFGTDPIAKDYAAKWGEAFAEVTGADVSKSDWYEDFRATKEAQYTACINQLVNSATAAQHLCLSLLAVREGATDQLIQELLESLMAAISNAETLSRSK